MVQPPKRTQKTLRLVYPIPPPGQLSQLAGRTTYRGSPKHKSDPLAFGLQPFSGSRGDVTLCDGHAGFLPGDVQYVRSWMTRGINAGLLGDQWEGETPRVVWAVADTGWIFEARVTNVGRFEYHGYPQLPGSTPISQLLYDRFRGWARQHPKQRHQDAVESCQQLYRLKS